MAIIKNNKLQVLENNQHSKGCREIVRGVSPWSESTIVMTWGRQHFIREEKKLLVSGQPGGRRGQSLHLWAPSSPTLAPSGPYPTGWCYQGSFSQQPTDTCLTDTCLTDTPRRVLHQSPRRLSIQSSWQLSGLCLDVPKTPVTDGLLQRSWI